MKSRLAFFASLALSFAALVLIQAARQQLALALRSWNIDAVFEQFHHRGAFLLYSAWVLAFGSAEFLWQSHRNQEPESAWPVLVLLGVFLYFGVAP